MKNCLLTIIFLSWWNVFQAQDYVTIERRDFIINDAGSNYQPDTFIISSPPSSGDCSAQCAARNGTKTRNTKCKCVCNKTEENVFHKSTFGVYDNSWKCASNTKVRNNAGCSILFNYENYNSPITTITSRGEYYFENLDSSCSIPSVGYANCSGKWEVFNQQSLPRFSLKQWQWGENVYTFLSYDTDNAAPNLIGRIVRVNITCTSQRPPRDGCVIFKIKGELNCSYSFSSSSLIQPTTSISLPLTQLSTSTSSTPKLPSTSLHVQQIKTLSQSLPTASATSTIPVSVPTSTTVPFSLPSTPGFPTTNQNLSPSERSTEKRSTDQSLTTSKIVEDSKKSASKGTDSSGMIAGAFAGVIGLAIIVIAIIVVMRKRKKRDAASPSKNTTIAENAGYGRGENSLRFIDSGQQLPYEDEYSYAYTNAFPFVKTKKQAMESHANSDSEPGSSVANQVYGNTNELNQKASAPYNDAPVNNTLEEAVYAKVDKSRKKYPSNSDAPIYNTLEEPEYAKVDKSQKTSRLSENHNEPLYNVLQGPETGEGLSEEPPCYQVLEGPFSEGAPVYDVLEGPESDEAPVYSALQGQDPRVYGALDMPDIQGSPEENRGYDDMVYDSVGDVINDQGDIYQELNQSGERNSDVYQALNNPGKTMYLNELNQTYSTVSGGVVGN